MLSSSLNQVVQHHGYSCVFHKQHPVLLKVFIELNCSIHENYTEKLPVHAHLEVHCAAPQSGSGDASEQDITIDESVQKCPRKSKPEKIANEGMK